MATFDEFFKSLDLDEEGNVKKDKTEKGLPFEQIFIKWFLINDPIWSSKVDRFLETGQDLGIDLIFEGEADSEVAVVNSLNKPHEFIKPGDIICRVDPKYYRPTEVESLLGDPSKAKKILGWEPTITVQEMCSEMVKEDLKIAKKNALLKLHGFDVLLNKE
mgnify:CR=1 FL=1